MTRQSRMILPAAVLAALMLAGCGSSAPPAPPVPPDKSVFISAKDCAESGKLKLERCGELIDVAIEDHIRSAPTYTSQKACEAVEGPERCERTDKKAFRPRLLAFVVVIAGEQSVSAPPLRDHRWRARIPEPRQANVPHHRRKPDVLAEGRGDVRNQ